MVPTVVTSMYEQEEDVSDCPRRTSIGSPTPWIQARILPPRDRFALLTSNEATSVSILYAAHPAAPLQRRAEGV